VYLKIHELDGQVVAAACDRDLMGKVLSEGKIRIDLEKFGGFYKGGIASEAQVVEAIKAATSANLVGKKAVGAAIKSGVAKESQVRIVAGVPHLQVYRV